MKRQTNIHSALSFIFAPQITPIYWFLLLYFKVSHGNLFPLLIAIIFSSLIQILASLMYTKLYNVGFYVPNKEKRFPLFLTSIISYTIGFIILELAFAPFIFKALMLAYIFNTVAAALITRYLTKISIHVWGISGPSVAILYVYGYPLFIIMLLLASVVGYSRIKLKAHTIYQVTSAVVCSLLITTVIIYGLMAYI